jgi:branched-chain amino acid transport system ATP-binding protein
MLRVRELDVFYGTIQALKSVSLEVKKGEIVCLLGANGAGKTTLIRSISRLVQASSGAIEYMDMSLNDVRPTQVVKWC